MDLDFHRRGVGVPHPCTPHRDMSGLPVAPAARSSLITAPPSYSFGLEYEPRLATAKWQDRRTTHGHAPFIVRVRFGATLACAPDGRQTRYVSRLLSGAQPVQGGLELYEAQLQADRMSGQTGALELGVVRALGQGSHLRTADQVRCANTVPFVVRISITLSALSGGLLNISLPVVVRDFRASTSQANRLQLGAMLRTMFFFPVAAFISAGGVALLLAFGRGLPYWVTPLSFMIIGVRGGIFMHANTTAIMQKAPPDRLGVVNSVRMMLMSAGSLVATTISLASIPSARATGLRSALFAGNVPQIAGGSVGDLRAGYTRAMSMLLLLALLAVAACEVSRPACAGSPGRARAG